MHQETKQGTVMEAPGAEVSRNGREDRFEVVVLDIDGAVVRQRRTMERYRPRVVPLRGREAELRNWFTWETMCWLTEVVQSKVDQRRPRVMLYGANDHHHLTYLAVSLLHEPVTVIGFDSSTDLMRSVPGYVWAGSWIPGMLKRLPHLQKVVQIGTDRDLDLSMLKEFPLPLGAPTHELEWFARKRFEAYPKLLSESNFLGRFELKNPSVSMEPSGPFTTRAHWTTLEQMGGMERAVGRILDGVKTDAVYVTVDKDSLREQESFTNVYDGQNTKQGLLTLDEVVGAIRLIKERKRLVGADVLGDFSYPKPETRLKKAWADWQLAKTPSDAIDSVELRQANEEANLRLLEALLG